MNLNESENMDYHQCQCCLPCVLCVQLFTDKETVMDALATGHDNHLMKINDRETQLVSRANSWKVALIKGVKS